MDGNIVAFRQKPAYKLPYRESEELEDWAFKARSGQSTVYFSGNLAVDREHVDNPALLADINAINEIAACAWELYRRGVVELVQERVREDFYRYHAVRTSKRLVRRTMAA